MMTAVGLLVILLFLPGGFADPIARVRDRIATRLAGTEPEADPEPEPEPAAVEVVPKRRPRRAAEVGT
jgi:hypothetical protein